MPIGPDRVQVLKQESTALGGDDNDAVVYPTPIEPQEDALESAGLYLQDAINRDENVYLARSGSQMLFADTLTPATMTLAQVFSGSFTENAHKSVRDLIHFIDNGPADGFASNSYCEISGGVFPTSVIWYTSPAKTQKIVETTYTRNGSQQATTIVWKMYASNGVSVLVTLTDSISYSGAFEASRTRTWV